ncbi:MAG: hypothetical protein AAF573_14430, partial [Bacteroidota bacterium]
MKKIFLLLFFLSVTAAAIWFFLVQKTYRNPFVKTLPIEAVPTHAPIILEFQDYFLLRHNIAKMPYSEEMSDAFFVKKMSDDFNQFRKLFSKYANHRSLLIENTITASMHLSSPTDMDFLYIIQDDQKQFELEKLLNEFVSKKTVSHGRVVHRITLAEGITYTVAQSNGLVLIAKHAYLVENGLKQLEYPATNLLNDEAYHFKEKAAGNKNEVRVSVLFENLSALAKPFIKKKAPDYFGFLDDQFSIGQWILNFREDGVHYEGDVKFKNVNTLLGNLLRGVKQRDSEFAKILPEDVAYFYRQRVQDKKKASSQGNLFKEYFRPWMEEEFLVGRTEVFTRRMQSEKFVAFPTTDFKTAQYYLEKLGDSLQIMSSWDYQTFPIRRLALDALPVPYATEEVFEISNPYYTIVENYVIFAGGGTVLEKWIDHFLTGQTLANHVPYIKMKGRSGQSQSLEGYWNFRNTQRFINNILVGNSANLSQQLALWEIFPTVGINGSIEDGKLSTRGFFYFQKEQKKNTKVKWRSSLTAHAHTPPYPIFNDEKGAYDILIQDEAHHLYSLNAAGEENRKLKLDGPIISEIYAAEFVADESRWLLFNTERKIYLMDLEGIAKNEFPIRLASPASNGLLLADFEAGDFGIFIACTN